MEVGQMQRQWVDYTKSLFLEGLLDGQFLQLQQLQDESNPDFVVEVVSLFFDDSEKLLNEITRALEQPSVDFKKIGSHVHQFKGSSSSVGAQRVKNGCIAFRNYCEEPNIEACVRCLQQLKQEYYLVKNKLQTLFAMEQQIVAAGAFGFGSPVLTSMADRACRLRAWRAVFGSRQELDCLSSFDLISAGVCDLYLDPILDFALTNVPKGSDPIEGELLMMMLVSSRS